MVQKYPSGAAQTPSTIMKLELCIFKEKQA
jgi:hypothetical protein